MSQTKERKRRSKAVPVLGAAAGLSFSLASSAPAAIGGVNPDPANSSLVSQQMMLCEEQIADVSLATFHVFDKEETAGIQQPHARLALGAGGCAGCGGCGCACGIGLYYHYTPPVLGEPVYPPPPRAMRPVHKYKR
jgi:hypothetical protein